MSLVIPQNFQHILRVMNTNIDGKRNIMFAMTAIKGIGRRYANIVLKKADIDLTKRAGELSEEEIEKIVTIMQNPRQYKIPDWFLNRQKDIKDGKREREHLLPLSVAVSFILRYKMKCTVDFLNCFPSVPLVCQPCSLLPREARVTLRKLAGQVQ